MRLVVNNLEQFCCEGGVLYWIIVIDEHEQGPVNMNQKPGDSLHHPHFPWKHKIQRTPSPTNLMIILVCNIQGIFDNIWIMHRDKVV